MLTLYGKKLTDMEKKYDKNLVDKEKNRIFVEDDEPSVLANGCKPIPTLTGDAAVRFLEKAREVEEEYERRMKEPPSLEKLKQEYSYGKIILEMEKNSLELREKKLNELQNKIKELEAN
jgi:hypothetical protein